MLSLAVSVVTVSGQACSVCFDTPYKWKDNFCQNIEAQLHLFFSQKDLLREDRIYIIVVKYVH